MEPALHPDLALAYLRELSADVRGGVVLDADCRRLAGSTPTARAAAELWAVCGEAVELEVALAEGLIFAARSIRHRVLVVTGPLALGGLVLHDLRGALAGLAGDGPPVPRLGAPASPLRPRREPGARLRMADGSLAEPAAAEPRFGAIVARAGVALMSAPHD